MTPDPRFPSVEIPVVFQVERDCVMGKRTLEIAMTTLDESAAREAWLRLEQDWRLVCYPMGDRNSFLTIEDHFNVIEAKTAY